MTQLVNLRGVNGSGKTYVVKAWMNEVGFEPYPRRNNLLGGSSNYREADYYALGDGGALVGRYSHSNCVGCDTFKSVDFIRQLIKARIDEQHWKYVLFEGIFISSSYQPWVDFIREQQIKMTWMFLDTPLEECTRRILERNRNKRISDVYKRKHKDIETIRQKATAAGEHVITIHWERAVEEFFAYMRSL